MQNINGYYSHPTIHKDKIIFVSEGNLWALHNESKTAIRLTASDGYFTSPKFSPDGKQIAFINSDNGGSDIYVMNSEGGVARRVSYLNTGVSLLGWNRNEILFTSAHKAAFRSLHEIFSINVKNSEPKPLGYGRAMSIAISKNTKVLGRNTRDGSTWKRYRGGTAGKFLIDREGNDIFEPFLEDIDGNLSYPMFIGDLFYFVSDHDGIGNLFSCDVDGNNLTQHTFNKEYYVKEASTDGKKIVFAAGADLYLFDPKKDTSTRLEFSYFSPFSERLRKFVPVTKNLEDYIFNNDASEIAVVSRGKTFKMGLWDGVARQIGKKQGIRYRLPNWMHDNKRILLISDESGEQCLEMYDAKNVKKIKCFENLDIGRPYSLLASPKEDKVLVNNHRNELILVDLESETMKVIDQNKEGLIEGFSWSPDGRWVAYGINRDKRTMHVKIFDVKEDNYHEVSKPVLMDFNPVFDPKGNYLYLLSARTFHPVYDDIHFDLGFMQSTKPYAIALRKDVKSPFDKDPEPFDGNSKKDENDKDKKDKKDKDAVEIDFDGIESRMIEIPVKPMRCFTLDAGNDAIFYGESGIVSPLATHSESFNLKKFDFKTQKETVFASNIDGYGLSKDKKAIAIYTKSGLKVYSTDGEKAKNDSSARPFTKKEGSINFNRIKLEIEPLEEWKQMFREAWQLQRDFFWTEDMSDIDWQRVYDRYYPLVDRVGTRAEFSKIVWEMQGELGTSHCYEFGGDYSPKKVYRIGLLGADVQYDSKHRAYKIVKILKGDSWLEKSPLMRLGNNLKEGMLIREINGQALNAHTSPNKLLESYGNCEISLKVAEENGKSSRTINVKTIVNDLGLRYRDWVEANRDYVHKVSNGKLGYVHIPDMGADGYAEFHRYFLAELEHDGIVIDVRFNGGGHVSQLILEKLARKRIGFDETRWLGKESYPGDSPKGVVVALTNEYAGSDGDIFSHSFKLMGIGTLIGTRTWGGVIGIWPRNSLVDGTVTTQPEFSFWFKDVGWKVENYGTEPDIEIDNLPQDYMNGKDAQLDKTIEVALSELEENPPFDPPLIHKPKLTLP